jgi:hypothetical protein
MPRSINKNKNKNKNTIKKRLRGVKKRTTRKRYMKRSLKGGDQTTVQQIMVDNLCKGTNNGGSIKGENQAASVHIENICSTSSRNNYNDNYSSNNSSTNSSTTSNFSGGSIISKLASVASYPLRTGVSLVKSITGVDLGSIKNRIMGQSQENNIGEQITNRIST